MENVFTICPQCLQLVVEPQLCFTKVKIEEITAISLMCYVQLVSL